MMPLSVLSFFKVAIAHKFAGRLLIDFCNSLNFVLFKYEHMFSLLNEHMLLLHAAAGGAVIEYVYHLQNYY